MSTDSSTAPQGDPNTEAENSGVQAQPVAPADRAVDNDPGAENGGGTEQAETDDTETLVDTHVAENEDDPEPAGDQDPKVD